MNMEYCYNCDELVEFIIQPKKQSIDIKGINIDFMAEVAFCKHCNEEIYINELEDKIVNTANEIYREKKNIIKISEIEFLLKKYQIGKKPLSKLLGWGESTISRYLDGLTPNIEYSNKLKSLFDSMKMKDLLTKNKGSITEIAFKKAINSISIPNEKSINKILQIADCFIKKSEETITPLKLQKLLYYFHAWCLVFYKQIFEEEFEAWMYGPVLPTIYYYYKDYGSSSIKSTNCCSTIEDKNILNLINAVYLAYGKYEAIFLKELTHKEKPWQETRGSMDEEERSNKIIENSSIKKYYLEEKERYKINDVNLLNSYLNNKVSEITS